jgi:hypothetical protein
MGEKKGGFLEKVGECYSISTKTETLPPKIPLTHKVVLYVVH